MNWLQILQLAMTLMQQAVAAIAADAPHTGLATVTLQPDHIETVQALHATTQGAPLP